MQARLTLKDGTEISLSDDVYQKIMNIMKSESVLEPAVSVEELETEFVTLFTEDGPSSEDLINEHRVEHEHDEHFLKSLS